MNKKQIINYEFQFGNIFMKNLYFDAPCSIYEHFVDKNEMYFI